MSPPSILEHQWRLREFRCSPHFAFSWPSGFDCIIYGLAGENGEWVVKTPQPHSWMKLAALRANSRTRKLSNFDRTKSKHLNGFLCIHFGPFKCCHIINYYMLNKVISPTQSIRRKHKPSVKQSDEYNTLSYIYSFWPSFPLEKAKSYNNTSSSLSSLSNCFFYIQRLKLFL